MKKGQVRQIDRISNIPDNVMETILMHLPTLDAVRTSILSRKWSHVVSKLPQFVLDESFWNNVPKTTLAKVLYQLLLGHDGPIYKFTLSYPELESYVEIDSLISFLSKRDIEDFSLSLEMCDVDDHYVLPSSIFSCQTLRYLEVRGCSKISSASIGFKRLTSLKLIDVIITAETLALLISRSPLLAILEIENENYYIDVCIDAPNLRTLSIVGDYVSINFKGVPILSSASIKTTEVNFNFVELFESLLALETLELSYNVIQNIGVDIPKRLSTSLLHLKDLKLCDVGFIEMCEVWFTLCLLRSSPNLKHIEISLIDDDTYYPYMSEEVASYMEGEELSGMCLSELREATLLNVMGTEPVLEFIKFLLAKSPSLKKIQIQPGKFVSDKLLIEIIKEVTKFRRISNEAEIIFF